MFTARPTTKRKGFFCVQWYNGVSANEASGIMDGDNVRLLDDTDNARGRWRRRRNTDEGSNHSSTADDEEDELEADTSPRRPSGASPSCNARWFLLRTDEQRARGSSDDGGGGGGGGGDGGEELAEGGSNTEDTTLATGEGHNCCGTCPPLRVVVTCAACFIVQFTLGVTYSTGNMLPYLTSYLHVRTDTSVGYAQTMWISSSHSLAVSAAMPFLGLLENHLPPWGFRLLGIVLFSGSYFGTSWAIKTSFVMTVVFLGIIRGCGQAILYPACLNLPLQWLPRRRGLLGGLIMAGFGGGGFLWDQVITSWINPHNLQPDVHVREDLYFNQTTVLDHVPTCYSLLGGVLSSVQILCLLFMSYPTPSTGSDVKGSDDATNDVTSESVPAPARESTVVGHSRNREQAMAEENAWTGSRDYSPLELLRSRAMWTITIFCFFVDLCVDIVFDFYKSYGQTFVHNDRLLSIVASFSAVVNAVSRPVWGFIADRYGFHLCLILSQAFLAFGSAIFLVSEITGAAMLFLVVCLIFLGAGGIYGLEYTLIFLLFGSKNFTFNLGCLGFVGVFSSLIDIYVVKAAKDAFGWHGIFLAASMFALIGLLINWSLVCDCGHPLPEHIKGPLFHCRRSLHTRSDIRTDLDSGPHQEERRKPTEEISVQTAS